MVREAWSVERGAGFCILAPASFLPTLDFGLWTLDFASLTLDFRIAGIGPHGEDKEERAQHVFALGHPGDRFHMQRMQGKESGGKGAAPDRARQASQQTEQQKAEIGRA